MIKRHVSVTAAILAMALAPAGAAADDVVTCATCHTDEAEDFSASAHKDFACRDCHAGEATYAVAPADLGKYVRSRRSPELKFDHGASFAGKPARADVPTLCGECHADVQRMNPFGLRTDQLARYWTSGHGTTLKEKGDDRVAVCIDCHGAHDILPAREPMSRANPANVPDTCSVCHANQALMSEYGLPVEVVSEYRNSVHGKLLHEQGDLGAPTCASCHGNHAAMPPGFKTVGAVCGRCHQHASELFATSIHATQEEHKGCVQCHGGGEDRHFHYIERITKPPGMMIQRYARLLKSNATPSDAQIAESIHPDAKKIVTHALPTCLACHEELEEDESLPKLFVLLDDIAEAERYYVQTADRLAKVGQGVLLVDNQRFLLEDANTHLIALAPIQHTLDNEAVATKVAELNTVCDQINAELDELETGLRQRHNALIPIWGFAGCFSLVLYTKFKILKRDWVKRQR